jgi:alanyl-tRNA synthetase
VRRIEAVTGAGSVRWVQAQRATVASILDALRVPGDQAVDAIERLQSDAKRLARELTQARILAVVGSGGETAGSGGITTTGTIETHEVCGVKVVTRSVADLDKEALRGLADSLRTKIKSGVVVLASTHDGKVQIVVAVTPDLTSRVKAGQVVKEIAPIVGGGGGGRPDFAEAGGRQPEKIVEMLAASDGVIARLLGAA